MELLRIVVISIIFYFSNCEKLWVHRNPRFLPFPPGIGNKLQIITGFGIPVDLKQDDVTFGLIMKTNYELPTNSAYFSRPDVAFGLAESDSKMNRWSLYSAIKLTLDSLSLEGENCLLRSICQAAFTAFEQNGLLGEILQVIFLPSSTLNSPNEKYEAAESIGKKAESDEECIAAFPNCTMSVIDLITTAEETILKWV